VKRQKSTVDEGGREQEKEDNLVFSGKVDREKGRKVDEATFSTTGKKGGNRPISSLSVREDKKCSYSS